MKVKYFLFIFLLLILLIPLVSGHEEEIFEEEVNHEENKVHEAKELSVRLIIIASIIILTLVFIAIFVRKPTENLKKILFFGIIIVTLAVTFYVAYSTITLNLVSETRGPVHWHADFEIWNCGKKIDVVNPMGLSNRVGSNVFHEHGDNRIHVEGVVINKQNVDLHNFINVIGGSIKKDYLGLQTVEGSFEVKDGDLCNGKEGKLQAFVYKTVGTKYHQEKIQDFSHYILSPQSQVPPGDCIIIEFDEEKERTDKICETYKAAIQKGDIIGS